MNTTHHQADARLRQARQDLEELDGQVVEEEIDPATAASLGAIYRRELEEAKAALATAAGEEQEQSTGRLFGFALNRRTDENIQRAGLGTEKIR